MDVYSRVRSFKATGYQALANDYFARAGVTDPIQKANYNSLFLELIAGGVDLNADFIYNFTAYNDTQAVTSLFNNFTATPVGLTGRFTPKVGVTFNGTGYINSGYFPLTSKIHYSLNDAAIGFKRQGADPTNYFLIASKTPENITIGLRGINNYFYCGINNNSAPSFNAGIKSVSAIVKRTSATSVTTDYDSNTNTILSNVVALDTTEIQIGAENNIPYAQNGTGLSHVYAGNSSLSKSVIDTAISNFVNRMA